MNSMETLYLSTVDKKNIKRCSVALLTFFFIKLVTADSGWSVCFLL